MSWYRGSIQLSASANASPRYLHEVDLTAASGNVTITLPATGIDPLYVGITISVGPNNGAKVVIVQTSGAVHVVRLAATGETAWVGRNPVTGAWEILAHSLRDQYQWRWANAAERVATQAGALQVGAIGYQTDIELEYECVGASPLRFGELDDPRLGPWRSVLASNNQTATGQLGVSMSQTVGSTSIRQTSGTTKSTNMVRVAFPTAASLGAASVFRNVSSAGLLSIQGMRYRFRFTVDTISASMRWCVGLSSSGPGANDDPANFLNSMLVGSSGAADANVQLYHNNGAGVAVKADLGASFPSKPADTGFQLDLFTTDGSSWGWQLSLVNNPLVATSGTLATEIPVTSTTIIALVFSSNNLESTAVALAVGSIEFASVAT